MPKCIPKDEFGSSFCTFRNSGLNFLRNFFSVTAGPRKKKKKKKEQAKMKDRKLVGAASAVTQPTVNRAEYYSKMMETFLMMHNFAFNYHRQADTHT